MSAEADAEIRSVLARIAQLADTGDLDEYVTLFADDAVWAMPENPSLNMPASEKQGIADIRAGVCPRCRRGRIFRGRFAQFSSRHHQHFLSIIAVGFIGPLFWPYAYNDFLNYTFYPYAYDAFWPGAYDDVYDGITGVYGSGIAPGYAGSGTGPAYVGTSGRLQPPSAEVSSGLCVGQTAGVTDWRINEIAQIVEPDEAQRATLEELKAAMAKAVDLLKAGCPTDLPSTPTGRIEAMRVRLSAMLETVRTVRAPLAKFYALLNDEQKARFNASPSGEDQNEPERRRNLSVLCSERASGISSVPIRRMELAVRPDEGQRASLRALQDAIAQAG